MRHGEAWQELPAGGHARGPTSKAGARSNSAPRTLIEEPGVVGRHPAPATRSVQRLCRWGVWVEEREALSRHARWERTNAGRAHRLAHENFTRAKVVPVREQ